MSTKLRSSVGAALALSLAGCATEGGPTEPEVTSTSATATIQRYAVRDLGTLGGSYSYAFGISAGGEVVGASATSPGPDHAFRWKNGTMTDLGTLEGGETSAARGINQSGDVVGQSGTAEGTAHAFRWRQGVMTDLGTLDGFGSSGANSVNGLGQVVGYSSSAATGENHAFFWQNGVMTDLGTLGGPWSVAYDINDSRQVVGSSRVSAEDDMVIHAFLWQNGVMADLGTLGGRTSQAQGINADGDVVGWSETVDGVTHAVQWNQGVIMDLGPFDGSQGFVTAINVKNRKVGFLSGARSGPAIWEGRKGLLLPTLGGVAGSADDINDAGLVAGSSGTSTGDVHAALWVPK
jgi:probable HAF family extracellular repeat protein